MVNIENYISRLTALLTERFGSRLIYIGLQGSYLRGEATDSSDIDIMAVIDGLSVSDLALYRSAVDSMEESDKACGFICSKEDLAAWNPLEICHLVNTTKDYYGALRPLVPAYTEQDIRNFIKMSINNLYHGLCHGYVHADAEQNAENLPLMYKGVFFILQNIYYLKTGKFASSKSEIIPMLDGADLTVMERSLDFGKGINHGFEESFQLLFSWCQEKMKTL